MRRAWTLDGTRVWLHPPFWSRKRWRPVQLTIREGEWVSGGEWWPVFRAHGGELIASEVPSSNLASIEPYPAGAGTRLAAQSCEVVTEVPCVPDETAESWTEAEVDSLLSEPYTKTRDKLARQYAINETLRRVVASHLKNASPDSRQLSGAMDIVSRTRDASQWESVAERARLGDRSALYVLKTWPDERGIKFFERALSSAGTDPKDMVTALSAVTFFVRCCRDHGLAALAGHLGDPWQQVENRLIVFARNCVGEDLDKCEESGVRVSSAWVEYLASLLLGTRIVEGYGTLTRSLALLRRHEDPRLPALIWRLIHADVDIDEDIVSCFTVIRSAESQRIARELAVQLSQKAASARSERRRERLDRVAELVRSALESLEA